MAEFYSLKNVGHSNEAQVEGSILNAARHLIFLDFLEVEFGIAVDPISQLHAED